MKPNQPNRKALFDHWSAHYDLSIDESCFPFIGYRAVLTAIVESSELHSELSVLDLGVGTGNLSKILPVPADQVWGADFSNMMLEKAAQVLPTSHLIQVDLLGEDWPAGMKGPFDRILSGYTLHEFNRSQKCALLHRLAVDSLAAGGLIVIGDISYPSRKRFDEAHLALEGRWDEEEYYWCAEEILPDLGKLGFNAVYQQVSDCGGVYLLSYDQK